MSRRYWQAETSCRSIQRLPIRRLASNRSSSAAPRLIPENPESLPGWRGLSPGTRERERTVASKSRHWPHEDVQSFLNLGERIGPTAKSPKLGELWRLSSLASLLAPKTVLTEGDFVTLEDAWRARRKHPI